MRKYKNIILLLAAVFAIITIVCAVYMLCDVNKNDWFIIIPVFPAAGFICLYLYNKLQ